MSHRCKTCGKAFHKADARRQHERDVHVERPRQRRAEARRVAAQTACVTFSYERQGQVVRGMLDRPPEFTPLDGGAMAFLFNAMRVALVMPEEAMIRLALHGQSACIIERDGKITEVDPWA